MKILHIATGFKLSYPGGITNYVRALARAQASMGNTVHVLARPENDKLAVEGIEIKAYSPSRVRPFALGMTAEDPSTRQIYDLLAKEKYEIVHFHMALDLPMDFLRDFEEIGIPYVVSLHDYFYICPRIYMVDVSENVCREVDLDKCRNCVGALDQINFLRRVSNKAGFTLPRVPSTATTDRMNIMRKFLAGAKLLLPVSSRTAAIYRNAVPQGNFRIEHIGNESAGVHPLPKVDSSKIRLTAIGTLSKIKGAEVLEKLLA